MNDPDLDFRQLRRHRGSQNDGFEELTRQLVLADPPEGCVGIENRGPGADGGVELLARFPGGEAWGWQCKFFLDSFGNSEVAQLKKSFTAALANFPTLKKYVVAIPRNLSGSASGRKKTQTQYWESFKDWAEGEATNAKRTIHVELWGESEFLHMLQVNDPLHAGIRAYWFQDVVFTQDWFQRRFDEGRQYIGKRYREADHIDLSINQTLQLVRRAQGFSERVAAFRLDIEEAQRYAQSIARSSEDSLSEPAIVVANEIDAVRSEIPDDVRNEVAAHPMAEAIRKLWVIDEELDGLDALKAEGFRRKDGEESIQKEDRAYVHEEFTRHCIKKLGDAIAVASGRFSYTDRDLFASPNLLITGEAGMGKSHLLAQEVRAHIAEGGAACFIPARVIEAGDQPQSDILKYIGPPNVDFETWLSALSAAGHASGKPVLIVIDGINETWNASGWEAGLPVLLEMVGRYPNLALVASIRTAYHDLCVRDGLNITTVTHRGFSDDLGRAAKKYLDQNGIERPSAPIMGLRDVFYNPLFLSTAVDALIKLGESSFPRDLDDISKLIKFWIDAVERTLLDKGFSRIARGSGQIQAVIFRVAESMASNGEETLSLNQAHTIAEDVIGLGPPTTINDRFIQRLIDEGVFLDYPSYEDDGQKFIVFGFQKFGDYFVADHIMRQSNDREALADGLIDGGKFSHLFDEKDYLAFAGVRIALFSLAPVRFECELPNLRESFKTEIALDVQDFIGSLSWRSPKSITAEAKSLLEEIRGRSSSSGLPLISDERWYDLLLSLALLPSCPLNANYLYATLKALQLPERDRSWSIFLVGRGAEYEEDWDTVFHLIDWSLFGSKERIDNAVIELAAVTLGLITSTSDREVRDCASKALANLMVEFPAQIPELLKSFQEWDDPYVRERVVAAALCGVLYSHDQEIWHAASVAVDQMVFAKEQVECHAWTRRYGRLIIEHAHKNGVDLPAGTLERCRPPYASKRIMRWPTIQEVGAKKDEARDIFHSVIGFVSEPFDEAQDYYAGDFGRYTMGGIDRCFSEQPRNGQPPVPRKKRIDDFWAAVASLGQPAADLADDLRAMQGDVSSASLLVQVGDLQAWTDQQLEKAVSEHDPEASKAELKRLEEAFLSSLPSDFIDEFKDLEPFDRTREIGIRTFSMTNARCWVIQRCLDLGWSKAIHERADQRLSQGRYSRNDHRVERIGKKYQHIARQELVGYLADHHWFVDFYSDDIGVLDRLEDYERADIDVTFFGGTNGKASEDYDPGGLCIPKIQFSADNPASNKRWAGHCNDAPEPTQFLLQQGNDGFEWCIVNCFVRNEDYFELFKSDLPLRSCQYSIELIFAREQNISTILALDTDSINGDDRDVFPHSWSSLELYGQRQHSNFVNNHSFQLEEVVAKIPFTRLVDYFSPKYSDYDNSGAGDEGDFSTPKPALISSLKLRPAGPWSRLFVDEDEKPAFVDRRAELSEACIIRWDLLGQFAKQNDLYPVWRVWVEKDGGEGVGKLDRRDSFVRRDYLGYFALLDDNWHGRLFPYRNF